MNKKTHGIFLEKLQNLNIFSKILKIKIRVLFHLFITTLLGILTILSSKYKALV